MSILNTQVFCSKRKSSQEEEIDISKRPRINESETVDLFPLFLTILDAIKPSDHAKAFSIKEATTLLSQNHDVLLTIQQAPIQKIQEQFNLFLHNEDQTLKTKKAIFQVLDNLYKISLFNSSTKLELENTNKNLPLLKNKVKPTLKEEIKQEIQRAEELLNQSQTSLTRPQIHDFLIKISHHLQRLNEYRMLKQYNDVHENQRILDLATTLENQGSLQQYPLIISDYPAIVKQISMLSDEIATVSLLINKLNLAQLKLQEAYATCSCKEETDPLEERFLSAFGNAFYNAFADHFWSLLRNSEQDCEILNILADIPEWKSCESLNTNILCAIWEKYLPDVDFSKWMVMTLKSMTSTQLDHLEKQLQELETKLNAVRENHTLEKTVKTEYQKNLQLEMQQLCSIATKPPFVHLQQLKTFLM